MLDSHECDEFAESEETNQFCELAKFGSSLFHDHVYREAVKNYLANFFC